MIRIGFIVMAAALAACTQASDTGPDLAKTCQVRECSCREVNGSIFDSPGTADVKWRADGEAFCPTGYELRLVPPPPPKVGGVPVN